MEQKVFSNIHELLGVVFEMDITKLEIITNPSVFKKVWRVEKLKESIMKLPKLRTY